MCILFFSHVYMYVSQFIELAIPSVCLRTADLCYKEETLHSELSYGWRLLSCILLIGAHTTLNLVNINLSATTLGMD